MPIVRNGYYMETTERPSYSDPTMCACGNPTAGKVGWNRDYRCERCIKIEAEVDLLAGHTEEHYVQLGAAKEE